MSLIADEDLLAYLDEQLPVEAAAAIETELRSSPALRTRAALLLEQRESTGRSLGAIWRETRASCPSRGVLSAWLDGRLGDAMSQYIEFHLEEIGCRRCQANVDDLRPKTDVRQAEDRTRKLFETSVGRLLTAPKG